MLKNRFVRSLALLLLVTAGVMTGRYTDAKTPSGRSHARAANATAVATAAPTNWNFEKNHGRITRIYPEPGGVYFTFGGQPGQWQTAMNPANGYYFISATHPNYQNMVNLLYLAAEHDWNLHARTQPTLGAAGRADVIYFVQDFNRP